MAELYEVLLVDGDKRWHVGWSMDDETEVDLLLREGKDLLLFGSRPALEHYAQEHDLELLDDLPDEVDLDLGGWLPQGTPEPELADVSALWHLLLDDPVAGKPLAGEEIGEAYDDLVDEAPGWFDEHGPTARAGLTSAVSKLRRSARIV